MTRVMLGAVVGALVLVGCNSGGDTPPEENQVRVQVVDGTYGVTFEYLAVPTFTPQRTALTEFPQSVAEGAMLAAINAERARGGVCPTGSFPAARPLQFEAHLHRAATLYGRELVTAGKMELPHRSRVDNRVPSQRMVDAGYKPVPPSRVQWVFGESLAAGTDLTSPAEVIAAWKGSAGHCAALFENIGNGAVARVDGAAGTYWVLNIAGWENE